MLGKCPLISLLKKKKYKNKRIKDKNKRHEWAWKKLHPGQVQLAFYKGTRR
jgi:hypothetical protein